jgi:hypothetical protein
MSAVADGYPSPNFQWQVSQNGGVTWAYLSGSYYEISESTPPLIAWHKSPIQTTISGTYNGPVTSTLTIVGLPFLNGAQYRCVINNVSIPGGSISNAATLTLSN